jgi:hypothetical protein
MHLQSVGAAADDAGTVAGMHLVTDLAPLPARADPPSCLPVITLGLRHIVQYSEAAKVTAEEALALLEAARKEDDDA